MRSQHLVKADTHKDVQHIYPKATRRTQQNPHTRDSYHRPHELLCKVGRGVPDAPGPKNDRRTLQAVMASPDRAC
jgi:hypothetical protein